jgi:hypothetical protein
VVGGVSVGVGVAVGAMLGVLVGVVVRVMVGVRVVVGVSGGGGVGFPPTASWSWWFPCFRLPEIDRTGLPEGSQI